jgi:hypothetical protein
MCSRYDNISEEAYHISLPDVTLVSNLSTLMFSGIGMISNQKKESINENDSFLLSL